MAYEQLEFRGFPTTIPAGLPWTAWPQLTDGTASGHSPSQQMQILQPQQQLQIAAPEQTVTMKRRKKIAEGIRQEPSLRIKALQSRAKAHPRMEQPQGKLLTAASSSPALPLVQEHGHPDSEPSGRLSPKGQVYEVDDEDEIY